MLWLAWLGGCSNSRYVAPHRSEIAVSREWGTGLVRGDLVEVRMLDGERFDGVLVAIGDDSLSVDIEPDNRSGEVVILARADIASIEQSSFSVGKTILMTASVIGSLYVMLMIAMGIGMRNAGLN